MGADSPVSRLATYEQVAPGRLAGPAERVNGSAGRRRGPGAGLPLPPPLITERGLPAVGSRACNSRSLRLPARSRWRSARRPKDRYERGGSEPELGATSASGPCPLMTRLACVSAGTHALVRSAESAGGCRAAVYRAWCELHEGSSEGHERLARRLAWAILSR